MSSSSRRFWLLTHPRTASNLLIRMLALDDQATPLPGEKRDYFFLRSTILKMGKYKTAGKHLDEWSPEVRTGLMESYQSCFEALQKYAEDAEAHAKDIFVKEHASWLIEPVAETKWVFGENSTQEGPWMVENPSGETRSSLNETILPDQFLETWLPTFLIRHPALVFPSIYRTAVDNQGLEIVKADSGIHALEMTLHWSRTLYDWFSRRLQTSESTSDAGATWPIIIDADDLMTGSEVLIRYSKLLGFDPSKLKISWPAAGSEELNKMSNLERRMLSTISTSTGVVQGKTSTNLDIDQEAQNWKTEFGQEEGERMERWVRAAMPDYEYMRARRLRAESS